MSHLLTDTYLFQSARLGFRNWRNADIPLLAGLNADLSRPSPHKRSERIMQKAGMRQIGEFAHPALPAGHPLQQHMLYRITKEEHA